jgi:eukaryotic-like serine/threonine-protein kinase
MNRTVAIKRRRFLSNEHKKIERFLREGRATAELRHPNIVSVFDAAESDGQHYLAIEFVDGHPLSEFVSDKKFGSSDLLVGESMLLGASPEPRDFSL